MKPTSRYGVEDPFIEKEEFDEQPDSDYVANPPHYITISGVRYDASQGNGWGLVRVINGGPNDGQKLYLVRLPGQPEQFFVNSETGERTPFSGFGKM